MTLFVLQSALLVAIAYVLGCVAGCVLHRFFAQGVQQAEPAKAPAPKQEPAPEARAAPKVETMPEPKPEAPPKPEPAVLATAAQPSGKDDLKRIKGIGRQNENRLNAQGVTTFAQIAAWSGRDQENWGERLAFPGRIEREEWVRQAKALAEGGAGSKDGK